MTITDKQSAAHVQQINSVAQAKVVLLEKSSGAAHREEDQLDQAVENTFPASDPVAELPASTPSSHIIDCEDALLDKALEMTFPASDPVAVATTSKVVPAPALQAGAKPPKH